MIDALAPAALPCRPEEVDEFLSRPTPGVIETLARTPGPVLVLGASGKMGLHLCAMLRRGFDALGKRERVVAVSRFSTLRGREDFERFGVETIACDLSHGAELASLPDAPTVFFLAGVKFGTASNPELLRQLNAEMPQKVARRFAGARIVAFSSGCVYPFVTPATGGATEATPVEPRGDYAASCVARETAFIEASQRDGTPVALVRLNYAVEFRYGVLVDIAQKVRHGEEIDLTTGHVNVIWQADAVAHAVQTLALAATPAAPVNITGPAVLSVRTLAGRFGTLFGCAPRFVGCEAETAWLNNAAFSHARFGPPPTSVDDMIAWTAAWLNAAGETWHKPTGYERRDGRF